MLSAEGGAQPVAEAESGAPVGPSAEEENAFLSEQQANGQAFSAPRSALRADSEAETAGDLPPLEDLVKRIPMPARDLMEELFRAKFVTVKRVPKSALK
jgi:hypothetical protein